MSGAEVSCCLCINREFSKRFAVVTARPSPRPQQPGDRRELSLAVQEGGQGRLASFPREVASEHPAVEVCAQQPRETVPMV